MLVAAIQGVSHERAREEQGVKPVNSRDVGGPGCSQQELRVVQSSAGARESLPELCEMRRNDEEVV